MRTVLEADTKKRFRSCVMRAAYLAQDEPSITEAVMSLARRNELTQRGIRIAVEADWKKYLVKYPMTAKAFVAENMFEQIRVYVDTGHAGWPLTRRSATGRQCLVGTVWDTRAMSIQSSIAMSSGASALYGLLRGCAAGLGLLGVLCPTYPDPSRYWDMIQRHKITQFYTAPTAIRTLMRSGTDLVTVPPCACWALVRCGLGEEVLHRRHLLADGNRWSHDNAVAGQPRDGAWLLLSSLLGGQAGCVESRGRRRQRRGGCARLRVLLAIHASYVVRRSPALPGYVLETLCQLLSHW